MTIHGLTTLICMQCDVSNDGTEARAVSILFDLDNRLTLSSRHRTITKTRLAHLHTLPTVLAVALVIMTSASTNHDVDLEAQQVIWPPPGTSHDLPHLSKRANGPRKRAGRKRGA